MTKKEFKDTCKELVKKMLSETEPKNMEHIASAIQKIATTYIIMQRDLPELSD